MDDLDEDKVGLSWHIGDFDEIDINPRDEKITGKEFAAQMDKVHALTKKLGLHNYFDYRGDPTPAEIDIREHARHVFQSGGVLTKEEWKYAISAERQGQIVRRTLEPYFIMGKDLAEDFVTNKINMLKAAGTYINGFAKGFSEENQRMAHISPSDKIENMADENGYITPQEAYDYLINKAAKLDPRTPASDRQKDAKLYISLVFGDKKKLSVAQYKINHDALDPERVELQKDTIPPTDRPVKRAEPVRPPKAIKHESEKSYHGSSIDNGPVNPVALSRPQIFIGSETKRA